MKILSSESLLNGDSTLKVVKVRKCDQTHNVLKGHALYNEFCTLYGYYLYKIQSEHEIKTIPSFVKSLKAIQNRFNTGAVLEHKTANYFLRYIEIINRYESFINENKITPSYRMSCSNFFSIWDYKRGGAYNAESLNNKLFNETLYSEIDLPKRTHFYRLVEFYHSYISENLPEGVELYHPMPPEIGFNISHGIESLYLDKATLIDEKRKYYGLY